MKKSSLWTRFLVLLATFSMRQNSKQVSHQPFDLLMCKSTDGIHIVDRQGYLINANDAFRSMLGYSEQEMQGLHVSDWDPGWNSAALEERLRQSSKAAIVIEGIYRRKDGSNLNVEVVVSQASCEGRKYLYAASSDITERKRILQEMCIAATAFETSEAMFITDERRIILRVNLAFTEATGYTADEVVGKSLELLCSGYHESAFYDDVWRQIEAQNFWRGELYKRRKNGEVYPVWCTLTAVKGADGIITNYVGTQTDITRRKAAEKEIRDLAFYDPLTRLGNRRLLLDHLQQALADSIRRKTRGALLFLDLDNFKNLNDTAGHEIGDLLLQQVARRIATCIYDGDTVARLGGDEFVVILADLGANSGHARWLTEQVGARILAALNKPYDIANKVHFSSPSIGIVLFDGQQETPTELLRRADIAMYQAKADGRNTLRYFNTAMQEAINARVGFDLAMRQGLEQEEFVLHFQPQLSSDGKLIGAEALVRWQHPQRGLLAPCEFIPLAEESGLIIPLGLHVLEMACRQLMDWQTGCEEDYFHFALSVNVSARQFRQHDFVDEVMAILDRTGADARRLTLELTESMLVDNVEDTITRMKKLQQRGVRFALDDFGTGFSSLSYLKRLPLDQIKIDKSFVHDVLLDSNDAAIVKMIIVLAQSLGLSVIAEGVETEQQRAFLVANGCHTYQGYLFGRPMPVMQFVQFMQNIRPKGKPPKVILLDDSPAPSML